MCAVKIIAMATMTSLAICSIFFQGMDILDYPLLFALSLAPPTVQSTIPPSLGTLTACLSAGLFLMKKVSFLCTVASEHLSSI